MSLTTLTPRSIRALVRAAGRHGLSLSTLAQAAAHRFGDATALVTDHERFSFERLWAAVEGVAAGLYLHVLGHRPRVVVVACEGSVSPIALLAAIRLGLDVMPIDTVRHGEYLAELVPDDALLIFDGAAPDWHSGPSMSADRVREFMTADGSGLGTTKRRSRTLLLTSGTSGTPTPHLTRPIGFASALQLTGLHERIGISGTDRVLACTPLQHGHGLQLLASTLFTGAALVSAPHLSASARLDLMLDQGITIASGLPVQFERMLDVVEEAEARVPSLRRIVCGSEPLREPTVLRLQQAWGPVVMNTYGMTETGTVSLADPAQVAAHPGTVGTPLPGVELGIVGARRGQDATGRVWVRGGSRTVITPDLGRIEHGLLYILGRA